MNSSINPYNVRAIPHEGGHMSLLIHPDNELHYLAAIGRRVFSMGYDGPPSADHDVSIARLNDQFEIIESNPLQLPLLQKGAVVGFSQACFVQPRLLVGYLHGYAGADTTQYCLCHFNDRYEITKIVQLDAFGIDRPVVLKYVNYNLYAAHSYDPLKIISLNTDLGSNQIVHMQKIFNSEGCRIVGGAAVYLERYKAYLMNLRVEDGGKYVYSMWATLTDRYKLSGASEPFVFRKEAGSYEACTSMVVRGDTMYAVVSINLDLHVFEYSVDQICRNIMW